MSDKGDPPKSRPRAVLLNVGIDLLGESYTHFEDVSLSVVFVGTRAEEHSLGIEKSDVIL
jgi:hypothetical protein